MRGGERVMSREQRRREGERRRGDKEALFCALLKKAIDSISSPLTHLRDGIAKDESAIIMTNSRPYCLRTYGLRASVESPSWILKVPERGR